MKSSLRVLMTDDIQKVKVAVKVGDNEWRSLFVLQMHNFQSLIINNLHEVYMMFNAQSETHKHLTLV